MFLLFVPALLLSGCTFPNGQKGELKNEYGTIKTFLDHSPNGSYNYLESKTYPLEKQTTRCYDVNNKLYEALYAVEYQEIGKEEGVWNQDDWVSYCIPYDDFACIRINESGSGFIIVSPDLDFASRGFTTYIQLSSVDAKTLIDIANEMLVNYYSSYSE